MSYRNQLGAVGLDNLYCGSVVELQRKLGKVGLYFDTIDGDPSSGTWLAITSFASQHGLPKPVRSSSASTQQPLSADFCAALEAAANPSSTPTTSPSTGAPSRPLIAKMTAAQRLAIRTLAAQRAGEAAVAPPAEQGWWASQDDTVKYAIMGGGALVVVAAAYFALKG